MIFLRWSRLLKLWYYFRQSYSVILAANLNIKCNPALVILPLPILTRGGFPCTSTSSRWPSRGSPSLSCAWTAGRRRKAREGSWALSASGRVCWRSSGILPSKYKKRKKALWKHYLNKIMKTRWKKTWKFRKNLQKIIKSWKKIENYRSYKQKKRLKIIEVNRIWNKMLYVRVYYRLKYKK